MITKITVDVNCHLPGWLNNPVLTEARNLMPYHHVPIPSYRIYINNELMTERTWMWGDNIIISEHILVETSLNEFNFKLEPAESINQTEFYISNLTANDQLIECNGLNFNFTVAN